MRDTEKFTIAVATKTRGGLDDEVSEVFGRARAFAVVDIEDGEIKDGDVLENPAISYEHTAGPIVVIDASGFGCECGGWRRTWS